MSGHSVIDWRLCIICQKTSSEDLCCPILGSIDATVYSALWRSSENLVVCLLKSTSAIKLGINFVHNKDSWHKQCHQKFNTLMLKRMQLKRRRESMVSIEGEDSCTSRPKRQSFPVTQDVCLFYKGDGKSEWLNS